MSNLLQAQAALFAALRESAGESRFFLRRAAEDDALWVSDLPRKTVDLRQAERALESLHIRCWLEPGACLWRLDWTEEGYSLALNGLPEEPPPLPSCEELHPAYALCRLLLLHPAPFGVQPKEALRAALKLCEAPRAALLRAIPGMRESAAEALRKGLPLPHAAGRVLAGWLVRQEAAPPRKNTTAHNRAQPR